MHRVEKLTIEQKIEAALAQIRPFLNEDGGDIHLVEVTKKMVVKVRFTGACTECSMQNSTFKMGVEDSILKAIPEIKRVQAID
ncbi:MAG: NifU family protein [Flavobacteriales bacterium]|nr:NifU family protein [Flavobacteriales bacterium]